MKSREKKIRKADTNYSENKDRVSRLNIDLKPKNIYTGIVLSEILGKPRSKKRQIR